MKARRIVSFAALAMALSAGALAFTQSACRTSVVEVSPSALFLGVSTDLVVDNDFDSIGLFVSVRGELKLARVEEVRPNGTVGLPGTLSITQPADPSTPVHIRVAGYKKGQVISVRDAISTVPTGRITLLWQPIQWLSSGACVSGTQRNNTGVTPTKTGVELKAEPLGAAPQVAVVVAVVHLGVGEPDLGQLVALAAGAGHKAQRQGGDGLGGGHRRRCHIWRHPAITRNHWIFFTGLHCMA